VFIAIWERDNPLRSRSWVVYFLILANSAIFFSIVFLPSYQQILAHYGFTPAEPALFTALTSMFLHGGFWHLGGNMIFLWMFGDNVEDALGPVVFAVAYLVGGLAATSLQWMIYPRSTVPCVGASGAISSVLGIYVVFFPRVRTEVGIWLRSWEITSFTVCSATAAAIWLGEQALLGTLDRFLLDSVLMVAFWAHIGGLLAGCALGFVFLALGYRARHADRHLHRHWLLGYAR